MVQTTTLKGARLIKTATFQGAHYDTATLFPPGFDPVEFQLGSFTKSEER
jgi:hypothetical protein